MTQTNRYRGGPAPQRPRTGPAPRSARPGGRRGAMTPMIILAAAVVAAGIILQCAMPEGFPLRVRDASKSGAVSVVHAAGALRINEIMSSNSAALISQGGESSDWVEILNTAPGETSLAGWTLAKNTNATATFTFPDVTLGAGECAVVFCDGTLEREAGSEFHAPFRLSASGDTLILFNPSGAASDSVNIPALGRDESYARIDRTAWEVTGEFTPYLPNTPENHASLSQIAEAGDVEITEIMASNASYVPDGDGEYPDYIEVHNTSSAPVNLKGYFLSDSEEKTMKWRFPEIILPADGYLIVYCSGKDKTDDDGAPHTSFRLSSEGETAVLSAPTGQPIDKVTYGLLKADQAWSKDPASGSFSASLAPTPGRANSEASAALITDQIAAQSAFGRGPQEVSA